MVGSVWLVLAAICLVFVVLGVWAVDQIFPAKPMNPAPKAEQQPRHRDRQTDGLDT